MADNDDYCKVDKSYWPLYERIEKMKKEGIWICDSLDHNENTGCSNPNCFKYNKKDIKP